MGRAAGGGSSQLRGIRVEIHSKIHVKILAVVLLLAQLMVLRRGADIFLDWLCNHPKALSVLPYHGFNR